MFLTMPFFIKLIYLLYSFLWWLILPIMPFVLLCRSLKEPDYRQYFFERFGYYSQLDKMIVVSPILWIHAVSVGETCAAQSLIKVLLKTYPQHIILLTHTTVTGRFIGKKLLAQYNKKRVLQSFFPYDVGYICARFLRYFKPRISILIETEIWPNMIKKCTGYGVPVVLVNARLSENSVQKGKRFKSVFTNLASNIDFVAAQSDFDAKHFRLFGVRNIFVTGNIKFDVTVPTKLMMLGKRWRCGFGKRHVLLCASTHIGEELLILNALHNSIFRRIFLVIIVPRHPQRFEEVATLIKKHNFSVERRSTMKKKLSMHTEVLLGDSMGEMFAYYSACDIAFIGGSLLPCGGQNLIEAFLLGKPVLIGPHVFNFQVISDMAVKVNAAIRVKDAQMMLVIAHDVLRNNYRRWLLKKNSIKFVKMHRGATVRTIKLIKSLLPC